MPECYAGEQHMSHGMRRAYIFAPIGLPVKMPDVNFLCIRMGSYNAGLLGNLSDLVHLHIIH